MTLKIHHLNCGTMCPYCERLITGGGSWTAPARMVCHVLLVETPNDGLLLVDTGLGRADMAHPGQRLGRAFNALLRPQPDPAATAHAQVQALGFRVEDVRHILLTHLDLDHAGGLPDFPEAQVHVLADEHAAAMNPGLRERARYLPRQWQHSPRWRLHKAGGDTWNGFEQLHPIPGLEDAVFLMPLIGHTRGHTGVAVRDGDGWLIHAGDSYFHRGEMDPERPWAPPGLALFEKAVQTLPRERVHNQERLRTLLRDQAGSISAFCAHDPVEFDAFAG